MQNRLQWRPAARVWKCFSLTKGNWLGCRLYLWTCYNVEIFNKWARWWLARAYSIEYALHFWSAELEFQKMRLNEDKTSAISNIHCESNFSFWIVCSPVNNYIFLTEVATLSVAERSVHLGWDHKMKDWSIGKCFYFNHFFLWPFVPDL